MLAGGLGGWRAGEGLTSLLPWQSFSNSIAASLVLGYFGVILGVAVVAIGIGQTKFNQKNVTPQ